jgi:hypothetical protein
MIYLEQLYMEIKRPKNWVNAPAEDLVRQLLELDPVAVESIDQALEEIEKSLTTIKENEAKS